MAKLVLVAAVAAAIWWFFLRKPPRPALPEEAEAREILGVGRDADADEIRAAHRRLVQAVHPDRGGSEALTRRINAARDVLLRRLRH